MASVKTFGLTQEEREALAIIYDTEEQREALLKLLKGIQDAIADEVLTYNLDKLVHRKARSEGAHKLVRDFEMAFIHIAKKELQK